MEEMNMTINLNKDGANLKVALAGRLDTITAPELEAALANSTEDVTSVEFDFADLEYISSAGLRVLLSEQKQMNKVGKMVIRNVNSTIMEVFEVTGFVDILTIE